MTNTDMALAEVLAFGLLMALFCWFAAPLTSSKPRSAPDPDPHQMELLDLDGQAFER